MTIRSTMKNTSRLTHSITSTNDQVSYRRASSFSHSRRTNLTLYVLPSVSVTASILSLPNSGLGSAMSAFFIAFLIISFLLILLVINLKHSKEVFKTLEAKSLQQPQSGQSLQSPRQQRSPASSESVEGVEPMSRLEEMILQRVD